MRAWQAANSPGRARIASGGDTWQNGAVRAGKWKLHLSGRDTVKKRPDQVFPALYDLSADIGEDHNVAVEHPEVVERLTKLIMEHRQDISENKRPVGKVE